MVELCFESWLQHFRLFFQTNLTLAVITGGSVTGFADMLNL